MTARKSLAFESLIRKRERQGLINNLMQYEKHLLYW